MLWRADAGGGCGFGVHGYTRIWRRLDVSFSILRRWMSFRKALCFLRKKVSSQDASMGESCFTRPLKALQPVTYSHSGCGKEIHGKLYNDLLLELRSVRFLAFGHAELFCTLA